MGFLKDFFKKHKKADVPALTVEDVSKLPTFSDFDLGLFWDRVTSNNLAENEKYFEQMSSWASDKGIQKYICHSIPVDQLFRSFVEETDARRRGDDRCNLYFCFNEGDDFLGAAYISAPIGQNKDSVIEYLVVNPNLQGKGIGTKMVKSITSFADYFNNGYQSEGIYASVNSENTASLKALLKSSFKVVSGNWTDCGKYYSVLYISKRDMENNKSVMEKE